MSILNWIRGKKTTKKPEVHPDRYHIKMKNEKGEWETKYMDCEMPVDPEDIPSTIFQPGERYMIWDDVEKRYIHSIKTPGKRKNDEGEREKEPREKRDLIERTADDISKVGAAFEKIGLGLSKVQESAAKLSGDSSGAQAIIDELRALREELKNQGSSNPRDVRQAFREELNYLMDMWKFFGFSKNSEIPPQVLDKLPGWSLMMYYPPSKAISELKDAGKEIVEHAIKTAKGELPEPGKSSREDYLAEFK